MIYTKLDETTLAMDRKMKMQNDEMGEIITKVSTDVNLVRDEMSTLSAQMNAQFAEIKSLI